MIINNDVQYLRRGDLSHFLDSQVLSLCNVPQSDTFNLMVAQSKHCIAGMDIQHHIQSTVPSVTHNASHIRGGYTPLPFKTGPPPPPLCNSETHTIILSLIMQQIQGQGQVCSLKLFFPLLMISKLMSILCGYFFLFHTMIIKFSYNFTSRWKNCCKQYHIIIM